MKTTTVTPYGWRDDETGMVYVGNCLRCGRVNQDTAARKGYCEWCGWKPKGQGNGETEQ